MNDCEKMLLCLSSLRKVHWVGGSNYYFPSRAVEKVPEKDDSLWEAMLAEVGEGEQDWMVVVVAVEEEEEEALDCRRHVEEVA